MCLIWSSCGPVSVLDAPDNNNSDGSILPLSFQICKSCRSHPRGSGAFRTSRAGSGAWTGGIDSRYFDTGLGFYLGTRVGSMAERRHTPFDDSLQSLGTVTNHMDTLRDLLTRRSPFRAHPMSVWQVSSSCLRACYESIASTPR